jgi:hypothetical protein
MSTITMQELELETAELLPARETLWSNSCGCGRSSSSVDSHNGDGDGDGNYYNGGFLSVNILSGDNGNLDGNTIL